MNNWNVKMPWEREIASSLHSSKHFQAPYYKGKQGELLVKNTPISKLVPGSPDQPKCSRWIMLAFEGAVAEYPYHCDLQPLTQEITGRISLMLLANCSHITLLDARLRFYNVQLYHVKWSCYFQEKAAPRECLYSGSMNFTLTVNVPALKSVL